MMMGTEQNNKKSLHHKLVEFWFHIINWCHPKMVTPRRAASPQTPLYSEATVPKAIQLMNGKERALEMQLRSVTKILLAEWGRGLEFKVKICLHLADKDQWAL